MQLKLIMTIAVVWLMAVTPTFSQQPAKEPAKPEYTPTCSGGVWWAESDATFADFDFWVGEWQVYDRASGALNGFDTIEKVYEGCALRQHWRQFNDRFTPPGAPTRVEGGSYSSLAVDGRWRQNWIDNRGSNLLVTGGLDAEGVMVMESDWLEFTNRQGQPAKWKYRWHWRPQADGTIHNWGEIATEKDGKAEWQPYFDIIYRRNVPGGPQAQLQTTDPES